MLEAIYDLEQPRAAWLEQLPSVTYHAFRGAIGISAVLYRMGGAAIHVDAVAGIDVDDEWLRLSREVHADPRMLPALQWAYRYGICGKNGRPWPDLDPQAHARYRSRMPAAGSFVVNGHDSGADAGCCINLFASKRFAFSAAECDKLQRMAAHLGAGCRLQRRRAVAPDHDAGTVSASDTLYSPTARASGIVPTEALSARERQVTALASLGRTNKAIAYALGLAHATVRVLLARSAAKFRVRNRAALIARFLQHQATAAPC